MIKETKSKICVDESGIIRPRRTAQYANSIWRISHKPKKNLPYLFSNPKKRIDDWKSCIDVESKFLKIESISQQVLLLADNIKLFKVSRLESLKQRELEIKFKELLARWKTETGGMSSPSSIRMNRNYQKIIGLGRAVIPLILQELVNKPDDWFYALEMLVDDNENPITEDMGFNESTAAWLRWGKDRRILEDAS
jgi:hypothetical protein